MLVTPAVPPPVEAGAVLLTVRVLVTLSKARATLAPALTVLAICDTTKDDRPVTSPVTCLWGPPRSSPVRFSGPEMVASLVTESVWQDKADGRACVWSALAA
jgi:hypothetical protein